MFGSQRLDISSPPVIHRQGQQVASHALPVLTQNTDRGRRTSTNSIPQRMTIQLAVRRRFFLNPYHTKGRFIGYTSDQKHLIYINPKKEKIAFVSDSNGQAKELPLPPQFTKDETSEIKLIPKTSNILLIRCEKKRFPVLKKDEAWQLPFQNGTFVAYTRDHEQFIYIDQNIKKLVFISVSTGQEKELELHTKITKDELNEISVIGSANSKTLLIRFKAKYRPLIKKANEPWQYPFPTPSSRPDTLLLEAVRTAEMHLESGENTLALLMNNLAL